MKKIIFTSVVLALILALAACGGTNGSATATANATALTQEELLLAGTFKLESTSLAVTPAQASELLPLWETLLSMSTSGTGATEEVDAVLSQIQSSMTADQIKSITAMKLTRQDLAAVSLEAGVSSNASSTASSSGAASAQASNNPSAGGPPADMAGGGAPSGATGSQAVVQADSQASSTQSVATTSQVSPALLNALVQLLQKKAG
jgi:hypothetical protein